MTDTDDIRVKVALAMGWTHLTQFTNRITDPSGNAIFFNPLEAAKIDQLPAFTTDHNAAFTLCDRLKSEGWRWRASTEDTHSETCFQFVNDEFAFEATADTLPMAICLAFLKVMESQIPS